VKRWQKLIVSALLFGSVSGWVQAVPSEKAQQLDQQINALNAQQSKDKASQDELYQQLKQQSKEVARLKRSLRQIQQDIQEKDRHISKLMQAMGLKQQQQQQQLEALYAQIRQSYLNAQSSYLKILLSQHDPAAFTRNNTYFEYFHQAREQQLATLEQALAGMSEKQKRLYAEQRQLESLYDSERSKQAALKQQTKKQQQTLAQLNKKITSQDAKLAALKQERRALDALVASLSKPKSTNKAPVAVKPNTPFASLKGSLPWPLQGKILARYGSSRNLGTLKWQGIMVASATGSEVRASAPGTVIFADWLRGFGLLIILDHGDKYMSLYGNNETLLKQVGDSVQAGELIAQSGDQGVRPLSALYFEIRHKGSPTNPLNWLSKQG
jgi:septal ring factor EnvC (AmiA/AmiB activator)